MVVRCQRLWRSYGPDWLAQNTTAVETLLTDHSLSLERLAHCMWTSDTLGAETLEQLAVWIADQAKAGQRIVCIDPITAATRTGQPWMADLEFLRAIKKTATEYGCSILLVTHLQRGVTEPSRENLAGSAAYERFAETIITIANHEPKASLVQMAVGTVEIEHNRTVRIEKARNGRGTGCRLAYDFDSESLTMKELGLIIKRKEGKYAMQTNGIVSKAGNYSHVIEHLKRMRGLPCIHISKQPLYPVSAIRDWIQREVEREARR